MSAPVSASLSPREIAVLVGIARGHTTHRIARDLRVRPSTVYTYRERLGRKLGTSVVADFVRFAVGYGLVPPLR